MTDTISVMGALPDELGIDLWDDGRVLCGEVEGAPPVLHALPAEDVVLVQQPPTPLPIPAPKLTARAEPCGLRELRRKLYTHDGAAIFMSSDSRARENPGPRIVGVVFCADIQESLVIVFYDRQHKSVLQCHREQVMRTELQVFNHETLVVAIAAHDLNAFFTLGLRVEQEHSYYRNRFKQAWCISVPCNSRHQLHGEVYLTSDSIMQLQEPRARFCFNNTDEKSPKKAKNTSKPPSSASSPTPSTQVLPLKKATRRRAPREQPALHSSNSQLS